MYDIFLKGKCPDPNVAFQGHLRGSTLIPKTGRRSCSEVKVDLKKASIIAPSWIGRR
jgi:hypothetical protein